MPKKPAHKIENVTSNQENNPAAMPGPDPVLVNDPDDSEVVDNLENNINELCEKYINELNDPEDIYNNNGLFVGMLKYIYRYYLSSVLNNNNSNGNRYNYDLLDKLFYIYTRLVYKYKKNKQPYIIEFTLFVNVGRETLYNIRYGNTKKASDEIIQKVKKWFSECEMGLLNTDTVGSIFRLKSMYGYNDNLAPVPLELQSPVLNAAQLPKLTPENDKKMLEDKAGS